MISFVRGRVVSVRLDGAVVDVGGIGLSLQCPAGALAHLRAGDEATIPTSMVVREDAWSLYGFASEEQRADFEVCQSVTGVGPKVAMAIVATLDPIDLRRAISNSDVRTLTKVPGIGSKGAARLVVELGDRLAPVIGDDRIPAGPGGGWRDDVVAGLTSLGWSAREAEAAAEAVSDGVGEPPDIAALLRAALAVLRSSG